MAEIDVPTAAALTKITQDVGGDANVAAPIVLRASAAGLASVEITIPTSTDPADGVMEVAVASAGKPVTIE